MIDHFIEAGAISADKAMPFTAKRRLEQRLFDRLYDQNVLLPGTNGGYYHDAPAYQKSRRKMRGLALPATVLTPSASVAIGLVRRPLVPLFSRL